MELYPTNIPLIFTLMLQSANNILSICIVLIGIFLVFFFSKNRDTSSNIWLAGLHLVLTFHFLNLFLLTKINLPHFGMVYGLLYGPLIWLFITSHTEGIRRKVVLHFIPAIALFSWIVLIDINRLQTPKIELEILRILVFTHLLCYVIMASNAARQFKSIAIQTRSKIDDDKIMLIKRVILGVSLVFLIALLESFTSILKSENLYQFLIMTISVIVLAGMFALIYHGLQNPFIFSTITLAEKQISSEVKEHYRSSTLTEDMAKGYLEKLHEAMENIKPYKNYNLTINELSEVSNIPPRHLSQIINEYLNQNFFDFVNSHRIEDAKIQLRDSNKRISEIMYSIGFSSRSSFNTAFKKYSDQTPSQYRKCL